VHNAKSSPRQTDEPYIWPVVGQELVALNAIADGLALVHSLIGKVAEPGIALDILAGEYPETQDLVGPIRLLAETVVENVARRRVGAPTDADRPAAIEAINAAIDAAHFRVSRRTRKDALADAGQLIQEIGLEFHDLQCILATERDGKGAIFAKRVPSPLAHAWLIEHLFQRVEAFVAADEHLALERNASAWFFECWSDGVDDGDPSYTDFPRMMREKEWSLVSRDTLSLDEPAIASLTAEENPPDVPPRQQRLATAYARSTVGVFEIIAVDGPVVTVRDASTGLAHRYHEHSEEANPYPGLLILGRMIPLEDDLWLRSPGAIMLTAAGDELRDTLSSSLTQMCETLPTPIALEGLISTAVFGATVPVSLLPAPTVTAARAALMAAQETFGELGLFTDVEVPPTAEGMAEQLESPALQSSELGVDQPVAEWLMALYEQASLDTPRPGGQAAKRKNRRRATQQHTRRRKR
jgi:hypothetical protein